MRCIPVLLFVLSLSASQFSHASELERPSHLSCSPWITDSDSGLNNPQIELVDFNTSAPKAGGENEVGSFVQQATKSLFCTSDSSKNPFCMAFFNEDFEVLLSGKKRTIPAFLLGKSTSTSHLPNWTTATIYFCSISAPVPSVQ